MFSFMHGTNAPLIRFYLCKKPNFIPPYCPSWRCTTPIGNFIDAELDNANSATWKTSLDIETLRQGKAFHFCYQIKKKPNHSLLIKKNKSLRRISIIKVIKKIKKVTLVVTWLWALLRPMTRTKTTRRGWMCCAAMLMQTALTLPQSRQIYRPPKQRSSLCSQAVGFMRYIYWMFSFLSVHLHIGWNDLALFSDF